MSERRNRSPLLISSSFEFYLILQNFNFTPNLLINTQCVLKINKHWSLSSVTFKWKGFIAIYFIHFFETLYNSIYRESFMRFDQWRNRAFQLSGISLRESRMRFKAEARVTILGSLLLERRGEARRGKTRRDETRRSESNRVQSSRLRDSSESLRRGEARLSDAASPFKRRNAAATARWRRGRGEQGREEGRGERVVME